MSNPIIQWIDQRFPLTSFVKHELTGYPRRAISAIGGILDFLRDLC